MVEFRLYYDDTGKVICYTCEALSGDNYIVIDAQTYAESRHDIRVIDGEISKDAEYIVISKMVESIKGISCEIEDICILTDKEPNKKWEAEVNEFRHC